MTLNEENKVLLDSMFLTHHYSFMRENPEHKIVLDCSKRSGLHQCANCSICFERNLKYTLYDKEPDLDWGVLAHNLDLFNRWYDKNKFKSRIEVLLEDGIVTEEALTHILIPLLNNTAATTISLVVGINQFQLAYMSNLFTILDMANSLNKQISLVVNIDGYNIDNIAMLIDCLNELSIINCINIIATPENYSDIYSIWTAIVATWKEMVLKRVHFLERGFLYTTKSDAYSNLISIYSDILNDIGIIIGNKEDYFDYLFSNDNTGINIQKIEMAPKEIVNCCDYNNRIILDLKNLHFKLCEVMNREYLDIAYIDEQLEEQPLNLEIEIIKDYFKKQIAPRCEACVYMPFCSGGCLVNSLNTNGELLVPDIGMCQLKQQKIQLILKIVEKIFTPEEIKSLLNNEVLFNYYISGGNYDR